MPLAKGQQMNREVQLKFENDFLDKNLLKLLYLATDLYWHGTAGAKLVGANLPGPGSKIPL